jgi:hypothetical protein
MKAFTKFGVLTSILLIVVLIAFVFGATPGVVHAAGKPPTPTPTSGGSADITVSGTQWGVSSADIGAVEGDVRFNIADLQAAGITSYHLYGGMSRWEAVDDDGVYGSPDIPSIMANPNVINWAFWDNEMTNPAGGSDYLWAGSAGQVAPVSARTILSSLQAAGIKAYITLRPVDNNNTPAWASTINPPTTQADWNEWWEHVFATVYWMDVRNNYNVNDWEVHNEPNNSGQGWNGTEAQYFQLVQSTADAINYVYTTYLGNRPHHIYAPATTGGSSWPNDALLQVGSSFDSVSIHNYNANITGYVEQVHGYMNSDGYPNDPLEMSEWGTYKGGYQNTSKGVSLILNNLIIASSPGIDHVNSSHIFSFYDWNGFKGFSGGTFQGLVDINGNRLTSFYALQMATKALAGSKPTYQTTVKNSSLMAITTKNSDGSINFLVTNTSSGALGLTADLSALKTTSTGTEYQYDATHNDVVVGSPVLSNGRVSFTIPGTGAILIVFP